MDSRLLEDMQPWVSILLDLKSKDYKSDPHTFLRLSFVHVTVCKYHEVQALVIAVMSHSKQPKKN